MIVRRLNDCAEFLAGDHTRLRELLHPDRAPVTLNYSLAHGRLAPGADSKRHRLSSTEVYYVLAGRGVFHIDGDSSPIESGMVIYVPSGAEQWVHNSGESQMEFLCLVDPAWKAEDEEVLE